jgi:MFS family permease
MDLFIKGLIGEKMKNNQSKFLFIYLLLLYVANLAAISGSYIIYLMPSGLQLLGASQAVIGMMIGLPRYALIVFALLLKNKADKVNQQRLSLAGAILGVVVLIFIFFSKDLLFISLCLVLFGFPYTISMSYTISLAVKYIPLHKRVNVLGIFITSSSLGIFTGPALGSYVNSFSNGTYPNFMILSGVIFCAIWGIFTFLAGFIVPYLKEPVISESSVPLDQDTTFKAYFPFVPTVIIFGLIFSIFSTFVEIYSESLKIKGGWLFFSGFALIALFERALLYKKMGIWKKKNITYIGLTFYFLGLLLLVFLYKIPFLWVLFLAGLCFGAGHGVLYPTLSVLFTDVTPRNVANATLVFLICFMAGSLFSSLIGYIVDIFGYPFMFGASFVVLFIGIIISLMNRKTQSLFRVIEERYEKTPE